MGAGFRSRENAAVALGSFPILKFLSWSTPPTLKLTQLDFYGMTLIVKEH